MSPVTFVIMIVLGIIMLSVPKRYAILPLLIGTCYISLGPRIVIAGADFTVTRIIILFGLIRLLNRSEYKYIVLSKLDKYLIVWVIVSIITGTINFGNISGFANRAGMAFDAFGFYFLIRSFLSEEKDIKALYYTIVILFIPLAFLMAIEKSTGRNPFGFFGGVNVISMIRDGKIRAQGPFAHAILAGTAGASILPYMISLWFEKKKLMSYLGIGSALIIVYSSGSSGPIMTFGFGMIAMLCWYCRGYLAQIRMMIFVTLIVLEIVMESHVWYLIARIDLTGSSTGYHRAQLITSAIEHLNEWWLVGTTYTRHWMATGVSWSNDHTDITNHYLLTGVNGGLPSMLLFISLIVIGFKNIGSALKRCNSISTQVQIWAIGASLFSHTATFISIAYFDQTIIFFYLTLALASSCNNFQFSNSIVPNLYDKNTV
jgi:hypothetical protein